MDPTAVELVSFEVTGRYDHPRIEWSTASVFDHAGFNIHRALSEDGPYMKINDQLILAAGTAFAGASYSHIDRDVDKGATYYYRLEAVDIYGTSVTHGIVTATVADGDSSVPDAFSLAPSCPNPFGAITSIHYGLPVDCDVQLIVYNAAGQKVRTLVAERQTAGYKVVGWDGRNDLGRPVNNGLYFYRLHTGEDYVNAGRVLLLTK